MKEMDVTTWYSKELGDGIEAVVPTDQIQQSWLLLCAAARQPVEVAVFSTYDTRSNVVTAYFSPAAHALARVVGAVPCEKPPRQGLRLMVGDERCWDHFFPPVGHCPEERLYD
jgi:hypothetical protein